MKYSSINEIIKDAKRGKMFILVDDEDRENEADLIIPASKVNPDSINFMARYGRGLICLTMCQKQADKLQLKRSRLKLEKQILHFQVLRIY